MEKSLVHDIFLLMISLSQQNSAERIILLFVEGINSIQNRAVFHFAQTPPTGLHLQEIATRSHSFGWLACAAELENQDGEFRSLIHNAVQMLAIILENRLQTQLLADEKKRLEEAVRGRTQSLVRINQDLFEEIAGRNKIEAELRQSEERYRLLADNSTDIISRHHPDGSFRYVSPACQGILGYPAEELVGTSIFDLLAPEDQAGARLYFEAVTRQERPASQAGRFRHKEGDYIWLEINARAVQNPANGQVVDIIADSREIGARKALEDQLRHDAMHDLLTGLPNRSYFLDQIRRSIERTQRHPEYQTAVVLLDLDRFKVVNDSLGHAVGDSLLVAFSQRLLTCVRPTDTIARLGGDEFGLLLDETKNIKEAIRVANRIQREVGNSFNLDGHEVFTTVSIGIALSSTSAGTARAEDLLRDADTALYKAKRDGRSRYEIFDSTMHASSLALLNLEVQLRRALERQEFCLYYHPIVSLECGKITALEALLRWKHPQRGIVLPGEFIALAEETGLTVPISEWALGQACACLRRWQDAGFADLAVSVNLSTRQLQDHSLPDIIDRVLAGCDVQGASLYLEIPEQTAMHDFERTVEILEELHRRGINLSIDDFGSSYSSLGYLKRFPVNTIKIDRSFIADLDKDEDDRAITTALIAVGQILKLKVVAEGVETESQLNLLRSLGCSEMQGFYFSLPLPEDEVLPFLIRNQGCG